MMIQVHPLTCDACGAESSTASDEVDELHDGCTGSPGVALIMRSDGTLGPGRWAYADTDGAELAGPSHDDDDAVGLAHRPAAWAPDDAEDLAEHLPPDVFESGTWRLLRQQEQHGQALPVQTCGGCGCTDAKPCPGGCIWASENPPVCSRCVLTQGAAHE